MLCVRMPHGTAGCDLTTNTYQRGYLKTKPIGATPINFMANNPTKARYYDTGGQNTKRFFLNRDGASIFIVQQTNNAQSTHEAKSCAEAKRIMANPGLVCK